jgi:type I restriction enzyme R subunit
MIFSAFEPQIQKLIDKHITTEGEVLKITELVNIFDKDKREAEVEKVMGKARKSRPYCNRTVKAINVK